MGMVVSDRRVASAAWEFPRRECGLLADFFADLFADLVNPAVNINV